MGRIIQLARVLIITKDCHFRCTLSTPVILFDPCTPKTSFDHYHIKFPISANNLSIHQTTVTHSTPPVHISFGGNNNHKRQFFISHLVLQTWVEFSIQLEFWGHGPPTKKKKPHDERFKIHNRIAEKLHNPSLPQSRENCLENTVIRRRQRTWSTPRASASSDKRVRRSPNPQFPSVFGLLFGGIRQRFRWKRL